MEIFYRDISDVPFDVTEFVHELGMPTPLDIYQRTADQLGWEQWIIEKQAEDPLFECFCITIKMMPPRPLGHGDTYLVEQLKFGAWFYFKRVEDALVFKLTYV